MVRANVRADQEAPLGAPREGEGPGSGVIYREDGYVPTNDHVVRSAGEVSVAFADGTTEEGRVVGGDPFTDLLAVIRVDGDGLTAANIDRGTDLEVGRLAVGIGSPLGFQPTLAQGVISGPNREIPAAPTDGQQETALVGLIHSDAPVSPGNPGGAPADRMGGVVGINVACLPPSRTGAKNTGSAIPSDTATFVADGLIEDGVGASMPYLGVPLADVAPEAAEQFGIPLDSGALVAEVESDSPAKDAGVAPRDVVTAAGSAAVRSPGDLLAALRGYGPGGTVRLTVRRRGGRGARGKRRAGGAPGLRRPRRAARRDATQAFEGRT